MITDDLAAFFSSCGSSALQNPIWTAIKNGLGGIVNSSRGITYAYFKNEKYPAEKCGEAAREEVIAMNHHINKEIKL